MITTQGDKFIYSFVYDTNEQTNEQTREAFRRWTGKVGTKGRLFASLFDHFFLASFVSPMNRMELNRLYRMIDTDTTL